MSLLLATIMLTFNSWRLTALAFGVVICAFGLSFLALALFRYPLGIMALVGVVGSIGVAINACIIILTSFQQSPGAASGNRDAMRDEVLDSSRHIISTTLTTFGGFLPLILEGSQFWPRLRWPLPVACCYPPSFHSIWCHPPTYFWAHRRIIGLSELN